MHNINYVKCETFCHSQDFTIKLSYKHLFFRFLIFWWDSEIIPRLPKIFEYDKNFEVTVFGILNNAFTRNFSLLARSGAEHKTFRNFRLGHVPLKMIFIEKTFCTIVIKVQRSTSSPSAMKLLLQILVFFILMTLSEDALL